MKTLLLFFLLATGSVHCAPTYSADATLTAGGILDAVSAWFSQHPAIAFYLAGLLGMLSHYVKKWGKGEYRGSLWAYLFTANPRASLAAVLTYVVTASSVIATGVLDGMQIGTILALAITTGYTIDSSVNSSGPGAGRGAPNPERASEYWEQQ